jgi:hypothetical protein
MKQTLKLLLTGLILAGSPALLKAQVPQKFNYQGIARDTKGNPMGKQTLGIKLSVLPTADATTPEYEEVQTITTNEFGLYTLQIGNGTAVTGTMKEVKWETGNKYIKVAIDPQGGTNYADAGTTQLLSVPYAIYADKAGMAKETAGGDRAGAVSTSAAGTGTVNFLTKFTAANTIYNSQVFDNGTNIGIGTTTPAATAKIHINQNSASVLEHMRMQNLSATGAGRFTMYSDGASNYSTFTKYGSTYAGGYAGITTLYPYANLLAFGNNGLASGDGLGRFLISTAGNAGISLFKGGTSKLKFHADFTTENVGIGGNAAPVSRVHLNNTDGSNMDLRLTNTASGQTVTDGLVVSQTGTVSSVINRENDQLLLGANSLPKVYISPAANAYVGIGGSPTNNLSLNSSIDTVGIALSNLGGSYFNISQNENGQLQFDPNNLSLNSSSIPAMTIDDDSRYIGVGTSTPGAQLDVNSLASSYTNTDGIVNVGISSAYHLTMDDNEIQGKYGTSGFDNIFLNYWGAGTYLGNYGSSYFAQNGDITLSDDAILVDSSTRSVGINTSSLDPSYSLSVGANSSKSGISIQDPVDNYALVSTKSGIWESIWLSKTNPTTSTPTVYISSASPANNAIEIVNQGTGLNSYSYKGYGVRAITDSNQAGYFYNARSIANPANLNGVLRGEYNGTVVDDYVGVYGKATTGSSIYGIGVRGEASWFGVQGNGTYGLYGNGNAGSVGTRYGVYGTASGATTNWAGYFSGNHMITGTKNSAFINQQGKAVLVNCVETPGVWFEDMASGNIQNGVAEIEFPQDLLNGVVIDAAHPFIVSITPTGDMGNFWVEKSLTGFKVHATGAANGTTFDYRVSAKRKGYEDYRLEYAGAAVAEDPYIKNPYMNVPNNGENFQQDLEQYRVEMKGHQDKAEEAARVNQIPGEIFTPEMEAARNAREAQMATKKAPATPAATTPKVHESQKPKPVQTPAPSHSDESRKKSTGN